MMINRIADYRKKRNLTQTDLANACDLSKNGISLIELGCSPRIDTVYKICIALHCNVEDIYPEFGSHAAKLDWISLYDGPDVNDNEITDLLRQIERISEKIKSFEGPLPF